VILYVTIYNLAAVKKWLSSHFLMFVKKRLDCINVFSFSGKDKHQKQKSCEHPKPRWHTCANSAEKEKTKSYHVFVNSYSYSSSLY